MRRLLPTVVAFIAGLEPLTAQAGRALTPEDWFRFQALSDLRISPDGAGVAYLVTSYDRESDESRSALWMANWAGDASVQLTRGESVSEPRFSPDGRYLSFLSARPAGERTQLWVLDRRGGEPRQLTHVSGELTSYEWSPDAQRLVLVMHAGGEAEAKPPQPIVIDAFEFKHDREGYLSAASRAHLYLFDVRSGACQALTADFGRRESHPAWSPDGEQIAYLSDPMKGPAQTGSDEIDLIAARAGATPRQLLTSWSPNNPRLAWSPDGTRLAFLQGAQPRLNAYIMDTLATVEVKSGEVRALTERLDRAVLSPVFAADGRSLEFAVEDDGTQYPARVPLAGGAIERLGG
ncbi:MAG TPA: hypothetical protein VE085_06435, partial [Burkholderiales bacterium]|nr:hypothetical protein [Burkholderiales bacterium]